jgi:hypothetical protein
MKLRRILLLVSVMVLLVSSTVAVAAGDFVWVRDLNRRAQTDHNGFVASLAARFKTGNAEIDAVLSNVARPADAYMVFRLGEMSGRPTDYVLERYRTEKGKGWGALAKSLGIKPGSSEFHALKRGHDLYARHGRDMQDGGGKGKAWNKDKHKRKNNR